MKLINDLLQQGVDNHDFPGVGYLIIDRTGKIEKAYIGYKQTYPNKVPIENTIIYDVASLTKVISTTTMIMKLIENNQLTLNTNVSEILPRFQHQTITVKHLLTHTSGLPADIPKAYTLRNRDDVIEQIYGFELINPVGKHIIYSDIGFLLLGLMVEKITQTSLEHYAHKVIFKPLDMAHTSYRPQKTLCAPTEYRNDTVYQGLLQGQVHDEKAFAMNGLSGHAGLFSTVEDIGKFIFSLLINDEKILQKKTVDLLFETQVTDYLKNGNQLIRALGWDKPTKGGTAGDYVSVKDTIVHTGFTGCNMWIDRNKGIGFVMLSNAVHPKRENNKIIHYRNKIGNIIMLKKETKK
ncbi:MAG: beta-lactamase family protein [Candidatus Izimaplasma sp.]|nr:beta-lactamase family protein [Candidatus Izimaplasma bacterium]